MRHEAERRGEGARAWSGVVACAAVLLTCAPAGAQETVPVEPEDAPAVTVAAEAAAPAEGGAPEPAEAAAPEDGEAVTADAAPAVAVAAAPVVEAAPAAPRPATAPAAQEPPPAAPSPAPPTPPPPPAEPAPAPATTPASEPPRAPTEPAAPAAPGSRGDRCVAVNPDGSCQGLRTPTCTILGTDGPDWLIGTAAKDVICGLGGDDRLDGAGGDDVVHGGDGDDALTGGEGEDCLIGGEGDDWATDPEDGERVDTEEPAGADADVIVGVTGECLVLEGGVLPSTEENADAGGGGGGGAVPASVGALLLAVSTGDGAAAAFPVQVARRAPVDDGTATLTLLCETDRRGTLTLTDRRGRRLGTADFTCSGQVADVEVELNDRGRAALERADGGVLRAVVRLTVDGARETFRVTLEASDAG